MLSKYLNSLELLLIMLDNCVCSVSEETKPQVGEMAMQQLNSDPLTLTLVQWEQLQSHSVFSSSAIPDSAIC